MPTIMILGFLLLVLGLGLIGVEMVIPGFGAPGIAGSISLILGVVLASDSIERAVTLIVIILVILAIMLTCVIVFFHSKKIKSPIALKEELGKKDGFLNAEDMAYLVDKKGITTTDLHPSGKCEIDGISFAVRSENGFIEKGKRIKVIKIVSNDLIVKEYQE